MIGLNWGIAKQIQSNSSKFQNLILILKAQIIRKLPKLSKNTFTLILVLRRILYLI